MTKCNHSRDVIRIIGTIAILGVVIVGIATFTGHPVPNDLYMVITAALGSLGSMLVNVSRDSGGAQAVQVVNAPNDPVPTTEAA